MLFSETTIEGAFILDVRKIEDERGFFGRAFCSQEFEKKGLKTTMVQTNISSNRVKGTLRGLHMQVAPHEEAKLVRCTKGSIFDVLVDLRENSPTFLNWYGTELTDESYRMLYIPEGCAHGYLTLADHTDVMYQVSQYYSPTAERGFLWNDPAFSIQWPITPVVISEKDKNQPKFDVRTLQLA